MQQRRAQNSVCYLMRHGRGFYFAPNGINEPGRLEEEHRLCYVGMTRAMKSLLLTYAESRLQAGQDTTTVCRFVQKFPGNTSKKSD